MSSYGKKIKKNEVQKTSFEKVTEVLMKIIILTYLFLIFGLFPFYMENNYSKLGDAKYHFFVYSSAIFLILMIIVSIMYIGAHMNNSKLITEKFASFSVTDYFAIAFLAVSFISSMFAMDTSVAFWGDPGWYMGLLAQTIFVMLIFFIARFFEWNSVIFELMMLVAACVFLIAVFQRFGYDYFDLYSFKNSAGDIVHVSATDVEKFVSTLGQTSWYSSYAVMIVPFGMFWYYNDDKTLSRIFSAIFIFIGGCSLCTVNNDSAYVAMVAIFSVFFWFALEKKEQLLRLLEIVLIFLGSFRFIGLLQDLFPEKRIELISGEEKITEFLNHSNIVGVLFILLLIAYIALRVNLKNGNIKNSSNDSDIINEKVVNIIRKVYIWGLIIAVWVVIMLIILTTKHSLPGFLSKLYNVGFLNFDGHWGNQRGFNWSISVKAIGGGSFKEWLIGVGPDNFKKLINTFYRDELKAFWGNKTLACAHCEWLNMIVNEGFLGVIAYAGIFITSIVRLGKTVKDEPMAMPFMAAILAYVAYNMFCYQQCISTTLAFIFIGIGEMIIRETRKSKKGDK